MRMTEFSVFGLWRRIQGPYGRNAFKQGARRILKRKQGKNSFAKPLNAIGEQPQRNERQQTDVNAELFQEAFADSLSAEGKKAEGIDCAEWNSSSQWCDKRGERRE